MTHFPHSSIISYTTHHLERGDNKPFTRWIGKWGVVANADSLPSLLGGEMFLSHFEF